MNGHFRTRRLAAVFGAILLAIGVGIIGYQLGVSHGIAVSGQLAAAPNGAVPYGALPYGWYRPHLFGFGPFFPFLFLLFWFVVLRGFLWGGRRRWHSHPMYWDDAAMGFEAWHRRAHERMTAEAQPKDRT